MCLFDKFNLTVDKGEFVSVVGSNGSGKTSMLNILCGSIPVDGGTDPDERRRYYNKERYSREIRRLDVFIRIRQWEHARQ